MSSVIGHRCQWRRQIQQNSANCVSVCFSRSEWIPVWSKVVVYCIKLQPKTAFIQLLFAIYKLKWKIHKINVWYCIRQAAHLVNYYYIHSNFCTTRLQWQAFDVEQEWKSSNIDHFKSHTKTLRKPPKSGRNSFLFLK